MGVDLLESNQLREIKAGVHAGENGKAAKPFILLWQKGRANDIVRTFFGGIAMTRKLFLAVLVGGLATVASAQQGGSGSNERSLKVTVNYTGSGTVDASHPIYVVLWDSPDFMTQGSDARPIQFKTTDSKTGSVTVSVTQSPIYVTTAFDPKGEWKADSAPPSGTSLGLYSKEPGKPAPVEIKQGQTASIDLPFDDSVKIP